MTGSFLTQERERFCSSLALINGLKVFVRNLDKIGIRDP